MATNRDFIVKNSVQTGSPILPAYGGTGIANTNTLSISGGNITLTVTGTTNVTFPTSGTLVTTTSGSISSSQLPAFSGDATSSAGTSVLTLATVNSNVGSFGDASHVGAFTVNGKGLITAASSTAIALAGSAITSGTVSGARLPAFTHSGDATGTFDQTNPGNVPLTLATVNSNVGSFGDTTHVGAFTVNGKGLITAASSSAIAFPVTSVFGRTGAVVLTSSDVTTALTYTPINKAGDSVSGTLTFSSGTVTGLAAPTNASDAATKSYVDSVAAGLTPKAAVIAASTVNLIPVTLSGSGVGKTITNAGTQVAFALDGVTLTVNQRVLIKNQTSGANNGIYAVTTVGSGSTNWVLTRATDFDGSPANEVASGDTTFVETGTTQATTFWVLTTADPITVDTTSLTFTQYGGPGTYSAGTGLVLTGTVFSLPSVGTSGTYQSVTTDGQGRVTAGTALSGDATTSGAALTLATVNSNTGTFGSASQVGTFTVNGKGLITAASNVAITAAAGTLTGTTLNSTVVTSSLTSVGTLGSLTVTGTASAGTFSGAGTSLTGTAASLTAGAATNVAGGAANSIPYQTGAGATTFLAQGTGVLQETAGAPAWTTTPTLTGTNITAVASITAANSTTNTAFDVPFLSAATGTVTILSNAGHTFNPSTGVLTVTANSDLAGITINGAQNNVALTLNNTQSGASSNWRVSSSATGSGFPAGSLTIGTGSSNFVNVSSAGSLTVTTTSGNVAAFNSSGQNAVAQVAAPSTFASNFYIMANGNAQASGLILQQDTSSNAYIRNLGSGSLNLGVGATNYISMTSAGNITLTAPTSGNTLVVNGGSVGTPLVLNNTAGQYVFQTSDGTCQSFWYTNGASGLTIGTLTNQVFAIQTDNVLRVTVGTTGAFTLATPSTPATNTNSLGGITVQTPRDVTDSINSGTAVTSGTITVDFTLGNVQRVKLGASGLTINLTNVPTTQGQAQTMTLIVVQNTGGSFTLPSTFQINGVTATVNWDNGTTPVLTTTAGQADILQILAMCITSGTTVLAGAQVMGNVAGL